MNSLPFRRLHKLNQTSCLKKNRNIPMNLTNRMIRMGCAAAKEDEVFEKIAAICEEQVQKDVGTLVSVIEPSLVGLLTVVIGAVLLSVMLPMAGMLSTL